MPCQGAKVAVMDLNEFLLADDVSELDLGERLVAVGRLLDVTRVLAAEVDAQRVLHVIARAACDAVGCERASLYQYDAKLHELHTSVVTELEIGEIRKSAESGITGYVARNRELVNVPEPSRDSRWDATFDRATGFTTRNILAAPLTSPRDGALLGVLQLLNNEGGAFDRLDEKLVEAFSQHAAIALDRARLVNELKAQQVVEASLGVARDIQRAFMPSGLPTIPGYEVARWWYPHQAVGGDYCDVFRLPDGRLGLVIADVSGHGVGPSLLMASVRAALKALVLEHSSPAALLELLSRAMAADLQDSRFITMFLGALDARSHRLEFANAGHAPAEHFANRENRFASLSATGVPLGIDEEAVYPTGPIIQLQVGDLIVLCTDGIVEAVNADQEPFGLERLEEYTRSYRNAPLAGLVAGLGDEVQRRYSGEQPADDLMVLALRRNA